MAFAQIHRRVNFGESLAVVGGSPVLGDWDPTKAVTLEWSEGDMWLSPALKLPDG
jgi:hypothetical protein